MISTGSIFLISTYSVHNFLIFQFKRKIITKANFKELIFNFLILQFNFIEKIKILLFYK